MKGAGRQVGSLDRAAALALEGIEPLGSSRGTQWLHKECSQESISRRDSMAKTRFEKEDAYKFDSRSHLERPRCLQSALALLSFLGRMLVILDPEQCGVSHWELSASLS